MSAAIPDPPELSAYRDLDRELFSRAIRPLVTAALIAEHRGNPFGHHSADLDRVLHYLRRHHGEQRGQYGILVDEPHRRYRVLVLSGDRDLPPTLLPEEVASSRAEAEHLVFCRRLRDLGVEVP